MIKPIRKYEIEITSLCNLECHVCHRTKNPGKFELVSITLEDIKRMFPTRESIYDMQFLLCGSIGEPVANKQCYEIAEYLATNGGWVELNSNASLQTTVWWAKLGQLSKDTDRVNVWFCVDGHRQTNHIYRKNSDFDIIERNMQSYSDAGGQGLWMMVLFDHNAHEVELCKEHAARLNFKFSTRTGPTNHLPKVNVIKRKDKTTKEVSIEEVVVKASGANTHSKLKEIELLRQWEMRLLNEQRRNKKSTD